MRQPQLSIVAGSSSVLRSAATPEPRRSPATTLVCWKLPYQPRRPPLDDVGGRPAPFAAGRETLHQTGDDEEERRYDADRLVGRQEADQHRPRGHQHDGEKERGLAAAGVAEPADDDPAERARHEAEAIGEKGRQQRRYLVLRREEFLGDGGGDIRIHGKVVPFENVADDRGSDRPSPLPDR